MTTSSNENNQEQAGNREYCGREQCCQQGCYVENVLNDIAENLNDFVESVENTGRKLFARAKKEYHTRVPEETRLRNSECKRRVKQEAASLADRFSAWLKEGEESVSSEGKKEWDGPNI